MKKQIRLDKITDTLFVGLTIKKRVSSQCGTIDLKIPKPQLILKVLIATIVVVELFLWASDNMFRTSTSADIERFILGKVQHVDVIDLIDNVNMSIYIVTPRMSAVLPPCSSSWSGTIPGQQDSHWIRQCCETLQVGAGVWSHSMVCVCDVLGSIFTITLFTARCTGRCLLCSLCSIYQ